MGILLAPPTRDARRSPPPLGRPPCTGAFCRQRSSRYSGLDLVEDLRRDVVGAAAPVRHLVETLLQQLLGTRCLHEPAPDTALQHRARARRQPPPSPLR